jgi:hypothetical protein
MSYTLEQLLAMLHDDLVKLFRSDETVIKMVCDEFENHPLFMEVLNTISDEVVKEFHTEKERRED